MKPLCREDHKGDASRSDVGDRRTNSDWAAKKGASAISTAGLLGPLVQLPESSGEMPHGPWRPHDLVAPQGLFMAGQLLEDLDQVVSMTLRVYPPRHGQPDQVHRCGRLGSVRALTEHDGADLATSDASFPIQSDGQGLPGIFERWDVREPAPGVHKHRVASGRPDDRDS